jgi:CIC family chloride channel protein
VAEMTGSLSILGPAMIAVGLAWFIVRRSDDTIYRSQLKSKADAPAQRLITGMPLLSSVAVSHAMAQPRLVLSGATTVAKARHELEEEGLTGAPVVDTEGRFEGTVSLGSFRADRSGDDRRVGTMVDISAPTVSDAANLDIAVEGITAASQHWVAVLDGERKVVGTVATSDVVRGYRLGLLASLQRMNADEGPGSSERLRVAPGSPLADRRLRDAELPPSIIITTIQRNRDLVVPDGETLIGPGDELVVIGTPRDLSATRTLAETRTSSLLPSNTNGTSSHSQVQGPLSSEPTA